MMLSACDECLNRIGKNKIGRKKCKRFPQGKPKDFRPYIDVCDLVFLPAAIPVQAPFENNIEYAERRKNDTPYNQDFILRCKEAYCKYAYSEEWAWSRDDVINQLMKAVPLHLRREVTA